MLDAGLRTTLVATGQPDNVLVTRRAADTEIQSSRRARARRRSSRASPKSRSAPGGAAVASKEIVMLIALPKRDTGQATNVTVRGLGDAGPALRPQVRIVTGPDVPPRQHRDRCRQEHRRALRRRTGIGQSLRFGGREWTVVGVFDGERLGVRLGDLGRRRADDAGVPAERLLLGGRAARRCRRSSTSAQARLEVRPAAHARREARARASTRSSRRRSRISSASWASRCR